MRSPLRLPLIVALLTLGGIAVIDTSASAQSAPARPGAQVPRPPATGTQRGRPATPAKPAEVPLPPPPKPPAAQDARFKTIYVTEGVKTETLTYVKGPRERFEFQDTVLLKQHDQKRTIQVMRSANTYLVIPDGLPAAAPAPAASAPNAAPKPPGVVIVSTTIIDTGERKNAFGYQARHVKTVIDKQPTQGACDTSKQRIETDGWYIDAPPVVAAQSEGEKAPPVAPSAARLCCG